MIWLKGIWKSFGNNVLSFLERRRYFTVNELTTVIKECKDRDVKKFKTGKTEIEFK